MDNQIIQLEVCLQSKTNDKYDLWIDETTIDDDEISKETVWTHFNLDGKSAHQCLIGLYKSAYQTLNDSDMPSLDYDDIEWSTYNYFLLNGDI